MNKKTIYTKTAKGLGEANGKTKALSRDLRNILKEIDGKTTLEELLNNIGNVPEDKLQSILTQLETGDFIREFAPLTNNDTIFGLGSEGKLEDALSRLTMGDFLRELSPATVTSTSNDLDFKSFGLIGKKSDAEIAEEKKAFDAEMARLDQLEKAKADIEGKKKAGALELEARRKADASARKGIEDKMKLADAAQGKKNAEEKTQRENAAIAQAKTQAEAAATEARQKSAEKARIEAEEKSRREMEVQAKKNAELRARQEAEEHAMYAAQAQLKIEAEEKKQREAQALAKAEAAEKEAQRKAEVELRRAAEEKARRDAEIQAKKDSEEKARLEKEAQAQQQAQSEAEKEVLRKAEVVARRVAEEKARREAEMQTKKAAEEKARAAAEALAREAAEKEQRIKREALARVQAEAKAKHDAEENIRREKAEKEKNEAAVKEALRKAEAIAYRLAREQEKREAEEKAKTDAQEKERIEAAEQEKIQEKLIAQQKTAAEAAEKEAKRKAEVLSRRQAEEKARRDAETQTKLEKEEKKRREAEEKAQEKARQEAEAKAQLAAELQIKKEKEESDRRVAEEKAQEKAKQDAEIKARLAAEMQIQKEKDENDRREAEEKEKAQAQQDAEIKARLAAEAEAKAEAHAQAEAAKQKERELAEEEVRRKAEEAAWLAAEVRAKKDAEELARRKSELQAQQKLQEEAAEQEARRKVEARARIEAEENERRAIEAREQQEPEDQMLRDAKAVAEHAQQNSTSHATAKKGKNTQSKIEDEEADEREVEDAEEEKISYASRVMSRRTEKVYKGSGGWGKSVAIGLFLIVALALGLVHVIPFDSHNALFEKMASEQFQQPVTIRRVNLSLVPQPHWRLEGVAIGKENQIKIVSVNAFPELDTLLSEKIVWKSIEMSSPVLSEEGLSWILFGQIRSGDSKLTKVNASNVKLESKNISLSAFEAKAELGETGEWKNITLDATDNSMHITLQPKETDIQIEVGAETYAVPFGANLTFKTFNAKGLLRRNELALSEFSGSTLAGIITGSAKLKWGASWSLVGDIAAKQIDGPNFLPKLLQSGKIEGDAKYAFQSKDPEKLLATPRLKGNFSMQSGTLLGVDFANFLGSSSSSGKTSFGDITGGFVYEGKTLQLRKIRLGAGLLSANGSADMDANDKLSGQFVIDLKSPLMQTRSNLVLSGTLKEPVFSK